MKRLLIGLVALAAVATLARAGEWTENYAEATARAKQEGKYLLIDFTGSDWCGWCKRLDAEVFSKQTFKDYAKESLVCLTVDFPRSKPQSKETQMQNAELSDKYGIAGYPTLILLDPDGNYAGTTGYMPGGPGRFVENLQGIIAQDRAKKAAK